MIFKIPSNNSMIITSNTVKTVWLKGMTFTSLAKRLWTVPLTTIHHDYVSFCLSVNPFVITNFMRIEDTALAWFIPTKTATHRITLDHSLLNLCGSPRCLSMHGYNNPIAAVKTGKRKGTEVKALAVLKTIYALSIIVTSKHLKDK